MTASTPPKNRQTALVWAAVISAAAVFYFAGIAHELIWYDESVSAAIAGHSFTDIFRLLPIENHPPLYFLLLRLATLALGSSAWAVRFISAAAAVGLVGLGAGPVRRILGQRGALIYAFTAIFTPVILIQAHDARMYSLANLAVTAMALYGYLAARDGNRRDRISFLGWSLAAAYLHYYGLIAALAAHTLTAGWALLRGRGRARASLAGAGLFIAGYLPWILALTGQAQRVNRTGFWIPPVSPTGILSALLRPFVYRELYPTPLPVLQPWMIGAALTALALIAGGLVWAGKNKSAGLQPFGLLLVGIYLGTLFTAIAISLVSTPVFYSRYMIVCTGLVVMLVSLGISQIKPKWLLAGALALFAGFNAWTIKDIYTQYFNLPFKQVRQALSAEIQPGDLIITSDCFTVGPAAYYFPQAVNYYASNTVEAERDEILKVMSPPLRYNEGLKELLAERDSFWALSDDSGLGREIPDILADSPGWELAGEPRKFTDPAPYSFLSFTLAKYSHTGQNTSANRGRLKIHVTGIRTEGTLVVDVFSGTPPGETNHTRRQFIKVKGGQADITINDLPYGDYLVGVFLDANGNYTPDFASEDVWVLNGEKVDQAKGVFGTPFEAIKYPFQQPELALEAPLSPPGTYR